MCQLNSRLKQVANLTKIVTDSETIYALTVVRSRTLLNELENLALNEFSGIYVNLCEIQRDIEERGRTCQPSGSPGDSPSGTGANSRLSRDERIASNCHRLREIETLLDGCVELIRQAAAQQGQGMTSS